MTTSIEYPPTVSGVKRGLKALRCTQERAARATDQSQAIVSMVLTKKAKSQPCLDKLAAFIKHAQKHGLRNPDASSVLERIVAAGR